MRIGLLIAGALALQSIGTAANILLDPSFESLTLSPWVTNWDVNTSQPHSGLQSVGTGCSGPSCLGGQGAAFLYQDSLTNNGATYTLSFYLSTSGPVGATTPNELKVYWGGIEVFDIKDITNTSYALYSKSLVATGTGARLEFYGNAGPTQLLLDDVSLNDAVVTSAVPEPATWMLLGAGLTGLAVRRRRR